MDAEKALCTHLASRLTVPVHYDVPNDRPAEFVTAEQTGGTSSVHGVGSKSLLVQCWAPSRKAAAAIADQVKTAVRSLTEVSNITGVRITSEYRDIDMDSGTPRWCLLVDIKVND